MESINWKQWLLQGRQYQDAGSSKNGAASKLSPTVVYNLFSMSLESYCMAILDYHGTLADNHTFTDLLDSLERVIDVDPELKRRILDLEKCQQICSFEDFIIAEVDSIVNREFQEVVGIVGQLAQTQCRAAVA
ncbi:MAG: hypothetical protein ACYSUT_10050 [Planctomycetota bacterium]|jgi:hypothetical protein